MSCSSSYMDSVQVMWFCAFFLAIPIISCLHEGDGRSSLPIEESLELNEHKSSNISHMKTIKTKYGDIYDCMELYKQPAFQHPLLKHHKIQMRPTFSQQKKVSEEASPSNLRYGLKEECPPGTVPIRRTTKEERLQAKAKFRQQFQGSNLSNGQEDRYAGLFTLPRYYPMYSQAGGHISTHNPQVDKGQLSAAVISVESGKVPLFETLRAGWMVYPDLFKGDNHTRLFTAWGILSYGDQRGCFNTYCSGFVQTNPKIPVDIVIDQISVPAGAYYYIKLGLYREKERGSWYLTFGESDEQVGYWPNDLFAGLKAGGDVIRWGGWVSSITPKLPMMGSGLLGNLGSQFRQLSVDRYLFSTSLNGTANSDLPVHQSQCYKAGVNSYKGEYWGDSFWYGGNGGDVQQCPD